MLARRLAASRATFEVFERNADVGGIWDIDAPGSPVYESAHFISSKTLSGFPDFPMPDDYPDYPDHRRLLRYIRAYADRFDLRRHISFECPVERAVPAGGFWELRLGDGGNPAVPLPDLCQRCDVGAQHRNLAGRVQRRGPPCRDLPLAPGSSRAGACWWWAAATPGADIGVRRLGHR